MSITSSNAVLNQWAPTFAINNLVGGQTLVYDPCKRAFINACPPPQHGCGGGGTYQTSLEQLTDVDLDKSTLVPGQVLTYAGPYTWTNSFIDYDSITGIPAFAPVATIGTLDSLLDVDTTGVQDNYTLYFDDTTSTWIVGPSGGGGALSLDDLTDVNINPVTLQQGQVLTWIGANNWTNLFVNYNTISGRPVLAPVATLGTLDSLVDVDTGGVQDDYSLFWNSSAGLWQAGPSDIGPVDIGLNDLNDVILGTIPLQAGQVLTYLGPNNWTNTYVDYTTITNRPSLSPVSTLGTLDSLVDVNTAGVVDNDTLLWDATTSTWLVGPGGGVPGATSLNELTDVNLGIVPLELGQVLTYIGPDTWTNIFVDYSDITGKPVLSPVATTGTLDSLVDVNTTGVQDDYTLLWDTTTSTWLVGQAASSLDELTDVTLGTVPLQAGQVLTYISPNNWTNNFVTYASVTGKPVLSPVSTLGTLDSLIDVNTAGVQDDYTLIYDSTTSTWLVGPAGGGPGASSLDDLTDVNLNVPALQAGQVLTWLSANNWTNSFVTYASVTGKPVLTPVATTGTLNSLNDVDTTGVLDDYTLIYDAPTTTWRVGPGGTGPGASSLNDLTDVNLVSPTNGQLLSYNSASSLWENATLGTLAKSTLSITSLSDVTSPGLANGYLRWNAAGTIVQYVASIPVASITGLATVATSGNYNDLSNKPVNATYSFLGLSDTADTAIANGYVLWNAGATQLTYSATIPVARITGLATVATSGSYNDLTNKPVSPTSFLGLSDTADTAIANGYVLWNSAGTSLIYSTTIPAASVTGTFPATSITGLATVATTGTLDSLNDVVVTTPTSGQVISYNGTNWVNAAGGGGGATSNFEKVVFKYSAGTAGTLTGGGNIVSNTTGVTAEITDGGNCIVSFSFTGHANPPTTITYYGQVTSSNKFVISTVDASAVANRILTDAGTAASPNIVNGIFTPSDTISLQITPGMTGTVGAFSVRAFCVVYFTF